MSMKPWPDCARRYGEESDMMAIRERADLRSLPERKSS